MLNRKKKEIKKTQLKQKKKTNQDHKIEGNKTKLHKNIMYQKGDNKAQQHIKHSQKLSDKRNLLRGELKHTKAVACLISTDCLGARTAQVQSLLAET